MLLTRLVEHAAQRSGLPAPYYRPRTVRWVIHLDHSGGPLSGQLEDRGDPSNPAAAQLEVPYVYRAGQHPPAMLLVDTLEYALQRPKGGDAKAAADAERRHQDFVDLIHRWHDASGDPIAAAIVRFYQQGTARTLAVPADARPTDLVAFRVAGQWAHQRPSAQALWQQVVSERKRRRESQGLCLVCGEAGPLLDTIPASVKAGAIPVAGGRGRDAQLVSINKPAQGRGGVLQLANTPLCERCGNLMMATLNDLLADERHRYRCPDSVLVWWLREPADFDPLANTTDPQPAQVKALIAQARQPSGTAALDHNAFYAVTLSVNQSRVIVRDWIDVPLQQVKAALGAWFDQQQVAGWQQDLRVFPLWRLVQAAGRWQPARGDGRGRYDRTAVPDGLERELLVAALRGGPLPSWLLPHLLQRVRADAHLDGPRAALLRLFLLRNRHYPREALMPQLNPGLADAAYQCGRAFAVLEALQHRALGQEVNVTVTDRLFRRAVSNPRVALVSARKTASAHLRKLRVSRQPKDQAAARALQQRLDDLFARIGDDIPAALDLEGQARFLLGYHQQRAADTQAAQAAKAAQAAALGHDDLQPPIPVED